MKIKTLNASYQPHITKDPFQHNHYEKKLDKEIQIQRTKPSNVSCITPNALKHV